MFVTAVLFYLVATTGLKLTAWMLAALVIVDIIGWESVQNIAEAYFTGTTSDQIWNEESGNQ